MNKKLIRLWKTKNKDDEWWSSFITSPLAIAVNYVIIDIKWITPNLITLFSFITAIISVLFIIAGGTINFIIAAVLIHWSHILDCMDGQMARYRKTPSLRGDFFDKLSDQIQVAIWFASVGYAAYCQSKDILPIFLAFTGVIFYNARGYIKYVTIYLEMSRDSEYLEKTHRKTECAKKKEIAGLGYGFFANLSWFINEQKKILFFDEGVFIFMLSLALIINELTPMLWVFAISQCLHGFARSWQRGSQISNNLSTVVKK